MVMLHVHACIHAIVCMMCIGALQCDAYRDILCVDQATVYPAAVATNDSQLNDPVGWGTPACRTHQHG